MIGTAQGSGAPARSLAPVRVRQPSHVAPPFGAVPFVREVFQGVPAGDVRVAAGTFNGDTRVPIGFRAEISRLLVLAGFDALFATTGVFGDAAALGGRFSVRVNGTPYPGYASRRVGGLFAAPVNGVAGTFILAPASSGLVMLESGPPLIHLQSGDAYDVVFDNTLSPVDFFYTLRLEGWLYQPQNFDDSLGGTAAD